MRELVMMNEKNDDDKPMTSYEKLMAKVLGGENFFLIYRDLFLFMTKMEAFFVSDLINRRNILVRRRSRLLEMGEKKRAKKVGLEPDGYFKCSMKFLQSGRHLPLWSDQEQRTLVNQLVKKGFIKTKRQGRDGTRWIKVDWKVIGQKLQKLAE